VSFWSANSDYRIKENITYLSNNELNNILKLKLCVYNYISDDEDHKTRIGFIAQDVETVYILMKHQRHFNDGYDTIYNESNSRER
jgi:hypothetical protein